MYQYCKFHVLENKDSDSLAGLKWSYSVILIYNVQTISIILYFYWHWIETYYICKKELSLYQNVMQSLVWSLLTSGRGQTGHIL